MEESLQFSDIRKRFEALTAENQNNSPKKSLYNTKGIALLPSTPNQSVGDLHSTKNLHREVTFHSETFLENTQQEKVKQKSCECQIQDKVDTLSSANSVQDAQTTKSLFTELIQEKARILRARPTVPEKPKSQPSGLQSTTISRQLSASNPRHPQNARSEIPKCESLQGKDIPSPLLKEKSVQQSLPGEEQKPFSVSKLRYQFEEKVAEQQISTKLQPSGSLKPPRPIPPSKPTLKVFPKIDYNGGRSFYDPGFPPRPLHQNFEIDEPMNFKMNHFEIRSLPRPKRPPQTQIGLITRAPSPAVEVTEYAYNPKIHPVMIQARNLEVGYPQTDYQMSSDDEFDDDWDDEIYAVPEEPIYFNYVGNTPTEVNDLPRMPSELPKQRKSYAEPRPRTLLKPSISFNQSDHVKKNKDERKEAIHRAKFDKQLEHITEELIKTEVDYVNGLLIGIKNYGDMFTRRDLPINLKGKRSHLFANIEQIAVFHRDVLLPMLMRNRNDLQKLCEEFARLIDNHYMYDYVLYTMTKKNSIEICENFAPYFRHLQWELNEKLGIESFLLQPVQRLPRYRLLFTNFLTTLFNASSGLSNGSYYKDQVGSLCSLEKKIHRLLETVNEASCICDILGWNHLNVCHTGNRFRKVLELYVFDSDRNRGYSTKVFIFDKCMIYTEIREKDLIFRGYYDASKPIELIRMNNYFTMGQEGMQFCDFRAADPLHIQYCLKFIEDMISYNLEPTLNKNVNIQSQAQPFRYSNRSDSGLGNMWTLTEENESD